MDRRSADGIAALSRRWAAESPSLEKSSLHASDLSAEQVFAAAAHGDPLGVEVIRRLGSASPASPRPSARSSTPT